MFASLSSLAGGGGGHRFLRDPNGGCDLLSV